MPRTPKAVADPPDYDPAVHTDPQQMVHVQMFCKCGGVWRQKDPVEIVQDFARSWQAKHSGEGHGPATIAAAIAEREARKESALRAAGRGGEYQRKTYETLDVACTRSRPWPVLPVREG